MIFTGNWKHGVLPGLGLALFLAGSDLLWAKKMNEPPQLALYFIAPWVLVVLLYALGVLRRRSNSGRTSGR